MEERPRFYTNHTGVHGGAFDITLDFNFQTGDEPPEPLARVSMSWEHAQAVLKLLEKQIDNYEEQVGRLPDIEKARVEQGNG